jgi:hypothetical protein
MTHGLRNIVNFVSEREITTYLTTFYPSLMVSLVCDGEITRIEKRD